MDASCNKLIRTGCAPWNSWRDANPGVMPDLQYADLARVDLSGFDLSNVNFMAARLVGSSFQRAFLYQAEFYGANVSDADFRSADLRGAKFHDANLSRARMCEANLYRVDFINTSLHQTDFDGAACGATAFSGVDLGTAINLSTVIHLAASYMDWVTLEGCVRHEGLQSFARSTGVPDRILDLLADSARAEFDRGRALDLDGRFASCFLSYSSADETFARRLHDALRRAGVTIWFAPESMRGGVRIREQVINAIEQHDKLIVILSSSSVRSNWVGTELRSAMESEARSGPQSKLFPIRLCTLAELSGWTMFEAETGEDLARVIRQYHIPDFSEWQNSAAFDRAVDRLLRDLKNG